MFINHSSKEVTAKIVYYGPGLSGKTTNLQYIFSITNPKTRGELISIETKIERTLFFDLLPINVGLVSGYQTKFQLYTVPGQIFYNSTRKLVLKGADGIVFVADSQELMKTANFESLENLIANLADHKQEFEQMPLVFQYNKRDLANILSVEELNRALNKFSYPYFSAIATEGKGVIETLRKISSLILKKIKSLLEQDIEEPQRIPAVEFDTNKNQKMIERVDLPLKVIPAESFETQGFRLEPGGSQKEGDEDTREYKKEGEDVEEVLTVETVEPDEGFTIQNIQDAFPGELPEQPLELSDPIEPLEEIKKVEEVKKPQPPDKEIGEIKNEKSVNRKKNPPKTGRLDLLDQLKDKSRVAVIKEVNLSSPRLIIDIKDKNSNLLESVDLTVTPETKKVTLILDIKNTPAK